MGQGLDKQLDCRSTWSNPKRSTPVSAQGSTNIRLRAQAISLEACKCASRMTARLDQAAPGEGTLKGTGERHHTEPGDDFDVPEFIPRG